MIYVHKMMNGMAHNCGLNWNYTENAGRLCDMISVKDYCKTQREQTFQYIGPGLYNILPQKLRGQSEIDELLV